MEKAHNHHNKILLFGFLVFLVLYNFTNIFYWWPTLAGTGHLIFNWPDATANYWFAELFAKTNKLWSFEYLNILSDNLIHARSINVIEGNLVPITFLPAIAIFGGAFRILGSFGILAFTPFLAALSGLLVYRLMNYIFQDKDISLISTLLFWSMAPWVFFANVVMLPNVLFIFLILAGFWALAKSLFFSKPLYWILACLFLSLAIFVRPTEIVWLAIIFIYVLYINRAKINWKNYLYGVLILAATSFWFLSLNKITYGAYFSLGYFNLQSGNLPLEFDNANSYGLLNNLKLLIAPFGFDFILIFKNIYKYFVKIFAPYLILAFIALVILFYKKKATGVWKKYIIISPIIFIVIFLYYGAWDLADPLVKELNKISISYVRYFLPLYIWTLPLVAWAIKKIFFGPTKINKISYYIIIAALILSSVKLAFYSKHDGLLKNLDNLASYKEQYQALSQQVEEQAVIISSRSDKVFFPEYRVIVYTNGTDIWPRVAKIASVAPIYYYTDQNISVDQEILNGLNWTLEDKGQIWHNFKLYKVVNN